MHKFDLADRFRLELRWEKSVYEHDGICRLEGAYFSGPALAEAGRINDEDYIHLDFYHQYLVLVRNVYVAKLSWRGVEYVETGGVKLNNAVLTHVSELNRVPKLESGDFMIIDTSDHETEKHPYNLLYKTFVVNEDTQLYRFGR
jgi:hypothetical protein